MYNVLKNIQYVCFKENKLFESKEVGVCITDILTKHSCISSKIFGQKEFLMISFYIFFILFSFGVEK